MDTDLHRNTPPSKPQSDGLHTAYLESPTILLALIALGDVLLWGVTPALSLVLFGLILLAAALVLRRGQGWGGWFAGAVLSLPLLEQVQTLSVLFWVSGMVIGGVWIALSGWQGLRDTAWSASRFLVYAPLTSVLDGYHLATRHSPATPMTARLTRAGLGWALPLGLGLVFLSLLAQANPVAEIWLERARDMRLPDPSRVMFWAGIAMLVWPFLRLTAMQHRLTPAARPEVIGPRQLPAIVNPTAVRRSLVLFNLIFAAQTGLDMAYLWGGAALPEGISYAQYAHRGAYPLLVTALLAGAFALVARPFTGTDPMLRGALMFWLVQTVVLVASSLMRLELYVEAYGLTRLRLAAGIWMIVVATGLGLTIWQVLRHHSAVWLFKRCAVLGTAALYAAMFLSFDRTIARYNLTHDVAHDPYYICTLGPAALPEIRSHGPALCDNHTTMRAPLTEDWREWGFRDWRVLRSLTAMSTSQESQVTWPTF